MLPCFLSYLLHFDSHAFLMNWLANLSGKAGGFKEMDLLQEHQNFWAKVCSVFNVIVPMLIWLQTIYNAKGSNCSWKWLAMVRFQFSLCGMLFVGFRHNTTHRTMVHPTLLLQLKQTSRTFTSIFVNKNSSNTIRTMKTTNMAHLLMTSWLLALSMQTRQVLSRISNVTFAKHKTREYQREL